MTGEQKGSWGFKNIWLSSFEKLCLYIRQLRPNITSKYQNWIPQDQRSQFVLQFLQLTLMAIDFLILQFGHRALRISRCNQSFKQLRTHILPYDGRNRFGNLTPEKAASRF